MSGAAISEAIAEQVRRPTDVDIDSICHLLDYYAKMGNLLPRSRTEIESNLGNFRVIGTPGLVSACGSLETFSDELGEIRSLMVDPLKGRGGLGGRIVRHLIQEARARNLERLMALTYVPEFFHRLGFRTVSKDVFPEKVWGICVHCYKYHNCDEIAVLLDL
jgi:amino-acid N-acetyltransferase